MKFRYLLPALLLAALPTVPAHAQDDASAPDDSAITEDLSMSADVAPPELPAEDEQSMPECPSVDYLYTPGYYAYENASGYYYVPGEWVAPPVVGYLWTPGYWAYDSGLYGYHTGYWGPTVGFYGGVPYGYGYYGSGYYGAQWDGGHVRYNTAVVRVNRSVVTRTYSDRSVIHRQTASRASFNGRGGITARPTRAQAAVAKAPHRGPTTAQASHFKTANRTNLARPTTANHARVNPARAARTTGTTSRQGVTRQTANTVRPQVTNGRGTKTIGKTAAVRTTRQTNGSTGKRTAQTASTRRSTQQVNTQRQVRSNQRSVSSAPRQTTQRQARSTQRSVQRSVSSTPRQTTQRQVRSTQRSVSSAPRQSAPRQTVQRQAPPVQHYSAPAPQRAPAPSNSKKPYGY